MRSPGSAVRACAGCAGWWATYVAEDVWFCPSCEKKRRANYDPQPNDVVHREGCWSGEFVVLGRSGDMVTIRRLGHPDTPPLVLHVANTMARAGDMDWRSGNRRAAS